MRIAVFGTGGVGGYFGGRLAQAGEEVVFIARGQHLRVMQESGLRVDSLKGDFVIRPAQAGDDPARLGVVDTVLLGVKAWQVPGAAQAMRPLVGPDTSVLPLQNGVEAPTQLAEALGVGHILGGLCRIISFVAGPGHIRHVGMDPYVAFGELDNRLSQRVERLRQAFARAVGVNVEVPADIHAAMWAKFLLIAPLSGLGAVSRAPGGVLRGLAETRQLLEDAMHEVAAVARARGISLPEDVVDRAMAVVDNAPPESTASMQRDIMEGRPSELASQNGAVVRLGREERVSTPINSFIYHSLLPLEMQARGQIRFPD